MDPSDIYWGTFLPVLLDRISMQMRKNMTAVVEQYGLTHSHTMYLVALNLQEGQTMIGLSRFLGLDAANTNRVIKVLREKGFVYDDRRNDSNKKFHLFLTDSGKKIAEEAIVKIAELNGGFFANVPCENIRNMRDTLVQVLNNMNCGIEDPVYLNTDNTYSTLSRKASSQGDSAAIVQQAPTVSGKKKNGDRILSVRAIDLRSIRLMFYVLFLGGKNQFFSEMHFVKAAVMYGGGNMASISVQSAEHLAMFK